MDKEKILTKLAEMEGYVTELKDVMPKNLGEYRGEKKRACERLLQIAVVGEGVWVSETYKQLDDGLLCTGLG